MGFHALLGFAPFVAFALVEKLVGIVPGLATGLVVSLALVAWEAVRSRTVHILEAGSALIFGGLTLAALHLHRPWSIWQVRLFVDAGLAMVVGLSVLLRRPFTLQHARKHLSADAARHPDVLRHNAILSGAWGLAFAGLALVDAYMTAVPTAPERRGILLTLAILGAAAKFTQYYVRKIRGTTPDAR
jgi:intracellular septation protein A